MKITRAVALLAHPSTVGLASQVTAAVVKKPGLTRRLQIALPLAVGASKLLKRAFPRQKPRLLSVTPRESFPSGHEAAATAFAAALIDGLGAWKAAPIAIAAVAFVGACRIDAREHRLSEVLAGCAVGLASAVIASACVRAIEARRAQAGEEMPA